MTHITPNTIHSVFIVPKGKVKVSDAEVRQTMKELRAEMARDAELPAQKVSARRAARDGIFACPPPADNRRSWKA